MDHRGPLSIDVSGAWYFITICAENRAPWTVGGDHRAPRTGRLTEIMAAISVNETFGIAAAVSTK